MKLQHGRNGRLNHAVGTLAPITRELEHMFGATRFVREGMGQVMR